MNLKTMAHICSLNGDMDEVTVLEKTGKNQYKLTIAGWNAPRFSIIAIFLTM